MLERARAHLDRCRREDLVDLALALLMAGLATLETLTGNYSQHSPGVVVAVGLMFTLPLAVRRRFPVAVFLFVLAAVALEATLLGSNDGVAMLFGLLVGTYTVAARTPLRTALACLLLFVPVMAYSEWQSTGDPFEDLDFIVVLISGFWIAGRVVWSRQLLVQQLAEQSEELRRARDVEARALVAEQRARIARDVHDIVAHSVSIMVVQAEAGEAQQPAGPSAEYLRAIMRVGRSTLTELRSVLGALDNAQATGRTGDEQARAPSPRLRDAARLVDQLGSTGLDVDLRVDGDPGRLPGGIDLTAYRVLQEALTNALRHSGAGRVRARVRVTRDEVIVDVLDPGCEPGVATLPRAVNGTGRGLVGMRERVRVYGGEVETGPVANGFRVHARIPVPASSTEAP